jgi:hypothetical protein
LVLNVGFYGGRNSLPLSQCSIVAFRGCGCATALR